MPRIERAADHDLTGAKRQRFPHLLHWTCPECQSDRTLDFRDRYLSYPDWGEELTVDLFCLDCDEMEPVASVRVRPSISVEVVDGRSAEE